jgi:NDP-sugar pyrophosphorylase family protein
MVPPRVWYAHARVQQQRLPKPLVWVGGKPLIDYALTA